MRRGPVFLMTDPAHYAVSYQINPWMRPDVWSSDPDALKLTASRASRALAGALRDLGAEVTLVPAAPGLPDLVFPANAAVVLDGRALMARFRHPERRGEEAVFHEAFNSLVARGLLDAVDILPEGCFQEGAGDAIWDVRRGWFWTGFGPRSTREGAEHIGACFGKPVVCLELATEQFYHLDTCFCPLSGGEVLYYPPAFTPAALAEIRARTAPEDLIEASPEDAARFCVNAVSYGSTLVMASAEPRLKGVLEARGYSVVEIDLSPFILSGGAAFCMTLRLDRSSLPEETAHVTDRSPGTRRDRAVA